MGFWRGIGKVAGQIVDIRADRWMGLKSLKNNAFFFLDQAKQLFHMQEATRSETFEEAVERLELTPEMLQLQSKRFTVLTVLFLGAAFLVGLYSIFLLFHNNWMGAFISLSLMIYALSCAFRFHFWRFQIQQKKLGCTVREWFKTSQFR